MRAHQRCFLWLATHVGIFANLVTERRPVGTALKEKNRKCEQNRGNHFLGIWGGQTWSEVGYSGFWCFYAKLVSRWTRHVLGIQLERQKMTRLRTPEPSIFFSLFFRATKKKIVFLVDHLIYAFLFLFNFCLFGRL